MFQKYLLICFIFVNGSFVLCAFRSMFPTDIRSDIAGMIDNSDSDRVQGLNYFKGISVSRAISGCSDNSTWQSWYPRIDNSVDLEIDSVLQENVKTEKALDTIIKLVHNKKVSFFSLQKYQFSEKIDESKGFVRNIGIQGHTLLSAQFLEVLDGTKLNVLIFNPKFQNLVDPYDSLGISLNSLLQELEKSEQNTEIDLNTKLTDRAVVIQTDSGTYYCARGPIESMISVWPEDQFKKACKYR